MWLAPWNTIRSSFDRGGKPVLRSQAPEKLRRHKFSPPQIQNFVISGFNTDIVYEGVTYHIQTEDKGLKTPFILSLVYKGGTILASKRSPYEDLIESGFDESVLEARVSRQHKLICAAIHAGRIDDLMRMTMKNASERTEGLIARKKEIRPAPTPLEIPPSEVPETAPDPQKEEILTAKPVTPEHEKETVWDIPMVEGAEIIEATVIDGNLIIEEEIILPPDAVKIIGDLAQFEPLLENELKVKILGSEAFQSGEQKNVNVLVCRGKEETAVPGAGIMIKVLGSDFRPQIFHSVADNNGVAAVSVSIPDFRSGRAAVLVRAMVGNEEAEIRRSITHKP